MTKNISLQIEVNPHDEKRCSRECYFIEKIKGLYTCTLFDEVVDGLNDFQDDELGYGFGRCSQCMRASGDA